MGPHFDRDVVGPIQRAAQSSNALAPRHFSLAHDVGTHASKETRDGGDMEIIETAD